VQVNIADDLFGSELEGEEDAAAELVYGEFEECMVRVASERHRARLQDAELALEPDDYAHLVEAFVKEELKPNFDTFVKAKPKRKLKAVGMASMLGLKKR
jgi:hypothetical protein